MRVKREYACTCRLQRWHESFHEEVRREFDFVVLSVGSYMDAINEAYRRVLERRGPGLPGIDVLDRECPECRERKAAHPRART